MTTRRELIIGASALLVSRSARSQVAPDTIGKIQNGSTLHRISETSAFRYSFGEDELRQVAHQSETAVIVHHGKPVAIDGYVAVYQHFEGLPIFTSKAASVDELAVAQAKDLVSGKHKNWKEFGGADLEVKIAVRQDGVWGRALSFMLAQNGLEFPSGAIPASSYEELADIGLKNPGTVLLGLRDTPARWDGLSELEVGKARISASIDSYPITSQITVFLKERSGRALDLGRELSISLSLQAASDRQTAALAPTIANLNATLDAQERK